MKLYELPRGSYFTLIGDTMIPPEARHPNLNKTYKLINIDGMYSYCLDDNKDVYHYAAWSDVEKVNDDSIQTIS